MSSANHTTASTRVTRTRARASRPAPVTTAYVELPSSRHSAAYEQAIPAASSSTTTQSDAIIASQLDVKPKVKRARKLVGEVKEVAAPSETRPAKFRVKAPLATIARMERVMSQRMFMMDRTKLREGGVPAESFAVLGSTGNVYTVIIDSNPTCNCPDRLKGNVPCKHIVFIFLKVLKISITSHLWFQKGLTESELKAVFARAPPSPNDPHLIAEAARAEYLKATGRGAEVEQLSVEPAQHVEEKPRKEVVGDDCPVCYEEMTQEDIKHSKLTFDESTGGCGNALHTECFQMWAATARGRGEQITCVYCRAPWSDGSASANGKGKGPATAQYSTLGYLNLADLVGVSRERDTSSYYHGPIAGRRMWEKRYSND